MATTVKFSRMVLFLAALLLAGVVTSAQAQIILHFNEKGQGSLNTTTTITGSLMQDPTNPGHTALTYMLPPLPGIGFLLTGQYGVTEPGGGLSEVIRTTNASGNLTGAIAADRLIFYSDQGTPFDGDLADTGIPPNVPAGITLVNELSDGGSVFPIPNTTASFILADSDTDPVPEPSSFMLLGTGLLGIVGYGRRKWNLLRQS